MSGFLHLGQRTKQLVYFSIFSFISFDDSFLDILSLSPEISMELASSFPRNFAMCSGLLLMKLAILEKLVRIVLVPS